MTADAEKAWPGSFVEFLFSILIILLLGWVLTGLLFSGDGMKNICERAAKAPKDASRDVLRDCRLTEEGKPVPLTREERRAVGLE